MSGTHAAIAAAQKKRAQDREEEGLSSYREDELSNWEFKIVRSISKAFRKDHVFYQLLEEEALAGWELLEKLDDGRIRFKRPVSARKQDHLLPDGFSPYRTQVGMSEETLGLTIVVVMFTFIGFAILMGYLSESGAF